MQNVIYYWPVAIALIWLAVAYFFSSDLGKEWVWIFVIGSFSLGIFGSIKTWINERTIQLGDLIIIIFAVYLIYDLLN
ncbi:MAG: hypothetical protein MK020_05350 [Dehalococcoidia bacterium]|nr:hypothetical protein [Dehalococcoidia bacterium]